jgi:sugar phosphate permease
VSTEQIAAGPPPPLVKPTRIRYLVLGMALAVAVLLYVDRFIMGNATNDIKATLGFDDEKISWMLDAFFVAYAFGQLSGGWLADRFGARRVLSTAVFAWSTCTALIGLAVGFLDMISYRFLCGLFESVAYPACAGMIRRWFPISERGKASGVVSLGGRLGGTFTPLITVSLIAWTSSLWPTVDNWRPAFFLFGGLGICLAGVFWMLHRDLPEQNPAVNAAELAWIAADEPSIASLSAAAGEAAAPRRLVPAILTNRSLWLCSIVQAGSNFGWVFLFQSIQPYLYEIHKVDRSTNGAMCSLIAFLSLPGVLLGGWLADALTRRLGRRWGRSLPMSIPRFVSAGLYCLVAALNLVWLPPADGLAAGSIPTPFQSWTLVVLCGLIALFSDLTLPAIWAYSLDVGGKNAGLVLGWGNMWGNLGAAASATLLVLAAKSCGWTSVFWICGGVFFAIAVLSLFVDATDTVDS